MAGAKEGRTGMADAMSKILGKQVATTLKTPMLAKAKAEGKEGKAERKRRREARAALRLKREARNKEHVGVLNSGMEFEARLRKVATRGAVTLFNAVKKSQQEAEVAASGPNKGEGLEKDAFMGLLQKAAAGKAAEGAPPPQASWDVLDDNFMHGQGAAGPSEGQGDSSDEGAGYSSSSGSE